MNRTATGGLTLALALVALTLPTALTAQASTGGEAEAGQRPRIGLVLSGGSAKGFAHIGVLEALEEAGVPVDIVVGTSMGAVVGGLYASGQSPGEIARAATSIDWASAFADRGSRRGRSMRRKNDERRLSGHIGVGIGFDGFEFPRGAIQGQRLGQLLREHLGPATMIDDFDQLGIRFRPVAVDLQSGEPLALNHGDLALAIRASMSIPGIIAPVEWQGRLLVDGGLRRNLPVEVAQDMGADVVIAVDVGQARPRDEEITSAFQIMDQAIHLMVRDNVRQSLALLEAGDIYLRIDVGDTGVTDFDQAGRLIEAGRRSARAHLDEIEELALSAEAFAAHLRARRAAVPARDPVITGIRLDNRSTLADRVITRHIRVRSGEPLDREALAASIDRIHGLGYFERVDHRLHRTAPGEAELEIVAVPNAWGPHYLRFAVDVEEDFDTRSFFNATASYLGTEINPLGAEIQVDVEVGSDPRLFAEFWQPVGAGSPWFIAPRAQWSRRDVRLFEADRQVGEVRLTQYELGLHAGRTLATRGEIRVGVESGAGETEALIGTPEGDNRDFTTGHYLARARWDGLDDAVFPRTGSAADLEWRYSTDDLGADDEYQRITLDANQAFSHGRGRNRWILGLRAGSTRNNDDPPVEALHSLGGFLNLGGFQSEALTGAELALGQVIYLREIAGYRTIGGLPFFLGGAVEAGNVWSDSDDRDLGDLITSGTLIAAVDTPLGPLFLGYGESDEGQSSAYLSLGRTF